MNLHELERDAILSALMKSFGNRTHAAHTLGISVRTLQRKLKLWGVESPGGAPSSTDENAED